MALRLALALALGVSAGQAYGPAARAQEAAGPSPAQGPSSGLAVPRFVSLKSNKVNVRRGPSTDQAIVWVFARAGLPVEIIAESDNWRRVRDSEGADGWVFHSLLSGRRTVLISPWVKDNSPVYLHRGSSTGARVVARLQPGVIGDVVGCDGQWCELTVDDYSGFVEQDKLWGVYRGENIE